MAKAYASQLPLSGPDILDFLRTFQGAAASFGPEDGPWSLWLPEFSAEERPLTPASQVFFPVILRHVDQAFAIRFFYDCATGRVRYYTSVIPEEIARLPELENAISELFRHSLPVEPIRQRSLGAQACVIPATAPLLKKRASAASLAEPAEPIPAAPKPVPPASSFALAPRAMPAMAAPVRAPIPHEATLLDAVPASLERPRQEEGRTAVHVEIGPGIRSVLMAFVLTLGLIAMAAVGAYTFLRATEDPGVLHHRLQIEELRQRTSGR